MEMTKEQKLSAYGDYLNNFENELVREIVEEVIDRTPTLFFGASTSSTGKYHPVATNGIMGLLKHSLAVMLTAEEFFRNEVILEIFELTKMTKLEKETILAACLLHDNAKYGIKETKEIKKVYTDYGHPRNVYDLFEDSLGESEEKDSIIYEMLELIATHMGPWIKVKGEEDLSLPETNKQKFVHLCDYSASRKVLDIVNEMELPEVSEETLDYFEQMVSIK